MKKGPPAACPFCGMDGTWVLRDENTNEGWVQCAVCHARGPTAPHYELAVPYWNQRRLGSPIPHEEKPTS